MENESKSQCIKIEDDIARLKMCYIGEIIFVAVLILITGLILKWVMIKIRLIQDPEINFYYNILTVRMY